MEAASTTTLIPLAQVMSECVALGGSSPARHREQQCSQEQHEPRDNKWPVRLHGRPRCARIDKVRCAYCQRRKICHLEPRDKRNCQKRQQAPADATFGYVHNLSGT